MPDNSQQPAPAAPVAGDAAAKKTTTRIIVIPATTSRPGKSPAPDARASQPAAGKENAPREEILPGALLPNSKMQTMRIELDDVLSPPPPSDRKQVTMPIPDLPDGDMPVPKPFNRKQVTMPIPDLLSTEKRAAPTVALKRSVPTHAAERTGPSPVPGRSGATESDGAPPAAAKHTTAPITVIPQTIRLKRTTGTTLTAPTQTKARTDLINEAPTVGRMPDLSQAKLVTARVLVEPVEPTFASAKRQTAPINVAAGPPGSEPVPQTIHLKRPSMPHMETSVAPDTASEAPTVLKTGAPSSAPADETAITQRKTIKIKRTERQAAPRTVQLKSPPAAGGPAAVEGMEVPPEEEAPSPVFFALAVAAALLLAGLVYIMAAQAFGPTLALPVPSSLL